jgi:hypothetical protein
MNEKKFANCKYYIPVNEDGICQYPLPQLPFSFNGISERIYEDLANCPTWEPTE